MSAKFAILSALVAVALAAPDRHPQQYAPPAPSYNAPRAPAPSYRPAPAPSYQPAPAPSHNAPRRGGYEQESYEDTEPKYNFEYAVQDDYSGVNFNQQESRDGYNTKGAYYVALPDGRTQKVTYYVDGDSGYVAEVSYEGEAQYPETESYKAAPRPSYQAAPQPSYQPAPQPSYQPAPQPSYQPAPALPPSRSYKPAPKPAYG